MGIRTNTLGKSAIVDMQLNKAYDVVEYVALNLPLIAELSKKLSLATSTDEVITHLNNTEIHLSQEEKDFLKTVTESGVLTPDELLTLKTQLEELKKLLEIHTSNSAIHLTASQKEAIAEFEGIKSNIPFKPLSDVAYSGLYSDLKGVPETPREVDSELSESSTNPVENQVITKELSAINKTLSKKLSYDNISTVAFTGSYYSLHDAPAIVNTVESNNPNPVSSMGVYSAIQDNLPEEVIPITTREIDLIIGD